jgi:uncharacterized protein YecE (DUF72 family)
LIHLTDIHVQLHRIHADNVHAPYAFTSAFEDIHFPNLPIFPITRSSGLGLFRSIHPQANNPSKSKFPSVITHQKKFRNCEKELELFYQAMLPLKDKLLTLLIQFPPSFKIKEGLEALGKFDFYFDETFRYAIEVRHPSWFNDLAYNFFKKNNICLVWNQLDIVQSSSIVTTDFTYIRFIRDRSISERDFGTIQRDRAIEMLNWANKLKEVEKYEKDVNKALVAANNHYAGFGPETANIFREMLGLDRVAWGEEKDIPRMVEFEEVRDHKIKPMKQTSLSDFIKK